MYSFPRCTHDGSCRHLEKFVTQWGLETLSPSLEARAALCASGGRVPWIRQEGLYDLQLGLLSNGFRLLKEGGCLVYATCSLCQRQNEDVVKALLEKEPTAVLEALPCSLACERPGGAPARPSLLEAEGPRGEQGRYCTARFDPATSGTSGLFVARLRKTPGAQCFGRAKSRFEHAMELGDAVELWDFPGGRGFRARRAIRRGEVYLTVPFESCWCAARARQDEDDFHGLPRCMMFVGCIQHNT